MARKLTPAAPGTDVQIAEKTPQAVAVVEARMNEHQQAVIEKFGDGLPWHPDHYEAEIRRELRHGCEAFLQAGRYLIVARECAAHGEWSAMLERLGIDRTHAHRMMEAAKRVAALPNVATSKHLLAAAGTQSKLIELLSLPEEQFAELATEGHTGELDIDDLAGMTVRDLRTAVREARADNDAKDERAAKRERDIEQLQKQLRQAKLQRQRATPDETLAKLRERTAAAALQVRVDISAQGDDTDSLYERFAELRAHAVDAGDAHSSGDEHDQYMAGLIGELLGELRRLRDTFGLPIVNDHGAPGWMQGE